MLITVADPHRPGDELSYYPGQLNMRLADVIIINKIDTADYENVMSVRENAMDVNPCAVIMEAASPITVENPDIITGKRVLVVEDGPTLTHGNMQYGAGIIAAMRYGAAEIIDPHDFAVGEIAETFRKYPDVGTLIPAMGYSEKQIKDLEATIKACNADAVVIGTPIDLRRIIKIDAPATRVFYDLQVIGTPDLESHIANFFKK
jgi:predicted GTPase